MKSEILSLEDLRKKAKEREDKGVYFSKICSYLEYRKEGVWYCRKFKIPFYCLAGREVYKGKRDCCYRRICEGKGKNCKTLRELRMKYYY